MSRLQVTPWVRYVVVAALAAALLVLAPVATPAAQAAPVTLSGVITNAASQPVAGARLRVRADGGTTILHTVTANGSGFYSVSLEPGTYDLTYLGAPGSGLLARRSDTLVSAPSTLDVMVTAQSITLTGAVTAPYAGDGDASVTLFNDLGDYGTHEAPHGTDVVFTVLPGSYAASVNDTASLPTGEAFFGGQTSLVLYEEDSRLDLAVPVHQLALGIQTSGGSPLDATVRVDCYDTGGTPGWDAIGWSMNSVRVLGTGPVLITDHAVGDNGPCIVAAEPDSGPYVRQSVASTSTSATVSIPAGIHLTGSMSDGAGNTTASFRSFGALSAPDANGLTYPTGRNSTPSASTFDIEVVPGQHSIRGSMNNVGQFERLSVDTTPTTYTADTVVSIAPVVNIMSVVPVDASGDPVAAWVQLECQGKPILQSTVAFQLTRDRAPNSGTATEGMLVRGTETGEPGSCSLEVHPNAGTAFTIDDFDLRGGETVPILVDEGVTVTGQVTLPGVTAFTPGALKVRIGKNANENPAAVANVLADGTFTVQHAGTGDQVLQLVGTQAPFGFVDLQKDLNLTTDTVENIVVPVDDLDVYLLDDVGNPATATLELVCSGWPVGQTYVLGTQTTRFGTGHVVIPGFAVEENEGFCTLKTTFAGGPVINTPVTIAPGGSTITQVAAGSQTLQGDPTATLDGDDVADALEAYADHQGDGNDDGHKDYDQPLVASLPQLGGALGSGEDYLTVASASGTALADVSTEDVTATPDATQLPDGVVDVTVTGVAPGSTPEITLFTGPTTGINTYVLYNSTTEGFSELPPSDYTIHPDSITVRIKDNGPFDRDLTAGKVRHGGGGGKDDVVPQLTLTGPVNGKTYTVGAVPAARCTVPASGGQGACTMTTTGANRAGVGTVTLKATATDTAGNVGRRTVVYKVVYKAGGLVAPAAGGLKVYRAGTTVVVRLKLLNSRGVAVAPVKAPTWVRPTALGKLTKKPNQPASNAKPDKGSVLVRRGAVWEFRWGTAGVKKGKTYRIAVRLEDGTIRSVVVGLG